MCTQNHCDSILTYGAEVSQVLGNLISTLLAKEIDFFYEDRFEYLGQRGETN